MEIRLWHDDFRPAPDGWVRTTTTQAAQGLLTDNDVAECSLGTGVDLIRWMIAERRVPTRITIHSWDPGAALDMAAMFLDGGYNHVVLHRRGLRAPAEAAA